MSNSPMRYDAPPDQHRHHPNYAADRALVLALFDVDGDTVDHATFNPLFERLSFELGLDAECIATRARLFIQLDTTAPSSEALATFSEDDLHEAGLDAPTKHARFQELMRCQMEDPAVALFRAQTVGGSPETPCVSPPARDAPPILTIADERALEALAMSRRGVKQKEIGAHFDVSDRTIRTWLEQARELEIATLDAVTPASAIAEDYELCGSMIADLRSRIAKAFEEGRNRLALDLSRELRAWTKDRRDLQIAIRLLDNYEHPEARRARYARTLHNTTMSV